MERFTAVGLCCICMVFGGAVSLARFGCNNLVTSTFDERKLAPPTNRNRGNMVIFPGSLLNLNYQLSTCLFVGFWVRHRRSPVVFLHVASLRAFSLQNFSVQKWNLPRYFMGKRGDKKMVNLQTSSISLPTQVLVSWCSPGLSLSKHR